MTQPEERYVDVAGIRTRILTAGSGPPMLLWHGDQFGGVSSASTWRRNFAGLARHHQVVAVDRLGQGFTDLPTEADGCTVEAVLAHMHAVVDLLALGPAAVVGQSRGAYFATRLVLDRPELATALVLADTATLAPAAGPGVNRIAGLLDDAPSEPRAYAEFRWRALSNTTDHITGDYLDEAAQIAAAVADQPLGGDLTEVVRDVFLPSLAAQKAETLVKLGDGGSPVPTLLTWGRDDPLAPLELGIDLFGLVSEETAATELHVFNRCGHFPYREYPDAFNDVVLGFLRRH